MRQSQSTLALAAILSPLLAGPAPSHAADTVAERAWDRVNAPETAEILQWLSAVVPQDKRLNLQQFAVAMLSQAGHAQFPWAGPAIPR